MKKIITLLLIFAIILSFNAVVIAAAQEAPDGCTQCFLKPKSKQPENIPAPETAPQATENPKSNQEDAKHSDSNQPKANQPNANQPNANQPEANQPNANRPNANQPNANRPNTGRQDRQGSSDNNRPKPSESPINNMQKKFDALSDKQRREVYKITDEITQKLVSLTDKYKELGLITKQDADQIKSVLNNGYEMAKESGRVIFALPPMSGR